MSEKLDWLVDLLVKFDVAVPRYTSYPTAPVWGSLEEKTYIDKLCTLQENEEAIALYVHIPFCRTMCLFCACSVVLNRQPENEERYIDYLCKEITLVASKIGTKKRVRQLHFGGGTPTKLDYALLVRLFDTIKEHFLFEENAEIAIEIDPRTVFEDGAQKLRALQKMGFNRVSFGVQDTNEEVQEAIRRRQSYSVTKYTYETAQKLGFSGINLDLIYGLPKQTLETFTETIDKIIDLRPSRLALFSYAKVPWLKEHQKAIKERDLPSTSDKFYMYAMARKKLVEAGYKAIGMDHFSAPDDELARAFEKRELQRNFQGYTVLSVNTLIGFGMSSIGYVQNCYVQNAKDLISYYSALDAGSIPCIKGHELSQDDLIRRYVVQRLMCDFAIDKVQFSELFSCLFDDYFSGAKQELFSFIQEGFVVDAKNRLQVTKDGELFIRNITACFDYYFMQKNGHKSFSRGI